MALTLDGKDKDIGEDIGEDIGKDIGEDTGEDIGEDIGAVSYTHLTLPTILRV